MREWAAASPASVSSVELLERGVDVVEIEHDLRRGPVVRVDLEDGERLGVESLRPLVSARHAGTTEGEALSAGRNGCQRNVYDPEVGDGTHVHDVGLSAVLISGVHDPTAIVGWSSRRPVVSAIASQSRAAKFA